MPIISATYYHDGTICANGLTYNQNARRGFFAAGNRWPLGTRLALTSRSGRRVSLVIADRIGRGSDVDCSADAFKQLAGSRWQIIGRLSVSVRVLSRPCTSHHHHPKQRPV
jgi:rare lipoprotein A (peptidoglycan hydrolase)